MLVNAVDMQIKATYSIPLHGVLGCHLAKLSNGDSRILCIAEAVLIGGGSPVNLALSLEVSIEASTVWSWGARRRRANSGRGTGSGNRGYRRNGRY